MSICCFSVSYTAKLSPTYGTTPITDGSHPCRRQSSAPALQRQHLGLRVWGSEFGVQSYGFRGKGSVFGVRSLGFREERQAWSRAGTARGKAEGKREMGQLNTVRNRMP